MTIEEAINYVQTIVTETIKDLTNTGKIDEASLYQAAFNMILDNLENTKHGSWRTPEKGEGIGWICTECEDSVTIPTAYCSNCGARMNKNLINKEKEA